MVLFTYSFDFHLTVNELTRRPLDPTPTDVPTWGGVPHRCRPPPLARPTPLTDPIGGGTRTRYDTYVDLDGRRKDPFNVLRRLSLRGVSWCHRSPTRSIFNLVSTGVTSLYSGVVLEEPLTLGCPTTSGPPHPETKGSGSKGMCTSTGPMLPPTSFRLSIRKRILILLRFRPRHKFVLNSTTRSITL